MVLMARTGVDREAGTGDDYTLDLQYVGACTNPHDLRVLLDSSLPNGALGVCRNQDIDYSFTQNPLLARHYSVVVESGGTLEVALNDEDWEFGLPIFLDGFESGDVSEWTSQVP